MVYGGTTLAAQCRHLYLLIRHLLQENGHGIGCTHGSGSGHDGQTLRLEQVRTTQTAILINRSISNQQQ